jgi:hypothetical protein
MKTAICVPHHGDVKAAFAGSLAQLAAYTARMDVLYNGASVRPQLVTLFDDRGTLELKRTALVRRARESKADYLLWVDSDQVFPPDGLLRLMRHDLPLVGCNYMLRDGTGPSACGFEAEPVWSRAGETGLQSVAAIGLGFCLVKMPVFDAIAAALPDSRLFVTEIGRDGEAVRGEDVHFCNLVRQAGFPVMLDHDLSREIGHVAEIVRMLGEGDDAASAPAAPAAGSAAG